MLLRRRHLLLAGGLTLALPQVARALPPVGRRLKLRNENTGETFEGVYRDEKGPVPSAIADLAALLRDHHSNKVGPVDVATLDFLSDVMAAIGVSKATVLSAFRTPATNRKLMARFGAAEHSQHLAGRAVDVWFDKRLADAAQAAQGMQRGGVGWYPRSHFVHLDTGPVRFWQSNGGHLDDLLVPPHPGRPHTVRERMLVHRALARRDFLQRKKGI